MLNAYGIRHNNGLGQLDSELQIRGTEDNSKIIFYFFSVL